MSKTSYEIETEFKKTSGACLLFGCLLATTTMAIHPNGGDIDHIIKIKSVLAFSHSIAIFCLPFIGFGFWGLSCILQTKGKLSTLAFNVFCFGLVAAMIAATINGLALPYFASQYTTVGDDISTVKKIIGYGRAINISRAYIFIAATLTAIGICSLLIIRSGRLPRWLGYFGLFIIAFGILSLFLKFNFTSLLGFRAFIFGIVSWKVLVGINMLKNSH